MSNTLVQTSLMPFNRVFNTLQVEEGLTVEEILKRTAPINFQGCEIIVTFNNELLNKELWPTTIANVNDIVGINVVPGKGGGGKSTLTTIITIAAFAAAPYAAGAVGTSMTAAGYGAGAISVAQGAVYLGIGMVASIATSSMMSTPKQSRTTQEAEKSIYFVEGASNVANKFGVIPINLGTNRIFPNLAALTYTETAGDVQYCRQLFTYGYGKLTISERKIGDTLLSNFSEVEYEDFLDGNLSDGSALYSNDVYQENLSVNITKAVGYITRTTQSAIDEAIIDITFQGLVQYDSAGNRTLTSVEFQIDYAPTGTTDWTTISKTVSGSTKQYLRTTQRIIFPENGQYDIRISRITDDSSVDTLINVSYLTALKSIKYTKPVNQSDISGTALRIRATDQLNGAVDKLNVIASTLVKSYDPNTGTWIDDVASSNPADIYRYILQSPAFAKNVADEKIDLDKLEEWWVYCNETGLTYNRYIDYDASVDDILNDVCAAGVATKTKVQNIYSVIIDNERPLVKGIVTPRNSWDYKGSILYPDIPHALRIEFRNKDKGYETDERIVYADGYDESTATLFERLEFPSCTNAELAYWYGRRYFATALLQPETHTFKMDFEFLTFNRGDRISFVNDVVLIGIGQGRIKTLITDLSGDVTGFTLDDTVTIPTDSNNFGVRIRHADASGFNYYLLDTVSGETDEFIFKTPVAAASAPTVDSLCAFVEDGEELDLIVTEIKPGSNSTATITAINYAPERFNPLGVIPSFESNITIPLDFYAPVAPELNGDILSDETVMIKNSDGSYISTMVIPLNNKNKSNVTPIVKYKVSGSTEWSNPTYLKRDPSQLILTDFADNLNYDFEIRYQHLSGTQQLSLPLMINNVKFIGGSTIPADVTGFRVSITNGVGLFQWTPNTDFDLSHYVIKFTNDTSGATWSSSQIAINNIKSNSVSLPIHIGTYLIKAVDYFGYESSSPALIVSSISGSFNNVVETLDQQPNFAGNVTDMYSLGGYLYLLDDALEGYYYFDPEPLDLSEIYECSLTSSIRASIIDRYGDIRDILEIRDVIDIREIGAVEGIRSVSSIRSLTSLRGLEGVTWSIDLEMNLSDDNLTWTGWRTFEASQHTFRYAKFRLHVTISDVRFNVKISTASVTVDMPDRYESQEDVEITDADAGATIVYNYEFKNNPSVNITLQNADSADKIEFTDKTNQGFTIKVFNATLSAYVTRTFDYISAGYGRVV